MEEINWPPGTVTATLHKDTYFCIDLWHKKGCSSHYDGVSPGDIVTCEDDEVFPEGVEGKPKCTTQWRLGNTIRLIPLPFKDMIPSCTIRADYADPIEALGRPRIERRPGPLNNNWTQYYDWSKQYRTVKHPGAACQWKGTVATYDFICDHCSTHCLIDRSDFVYCAMCPSCRTIYHAVETIQIERVT